MSFLNVMLLGGAAAFLAPLLIHLLNRSRFQSVDWGAMHLLEAAIQVNSRRLQWESWLLLLLRCLIPILLAICLARPVLTSLRVAGSGGKKSIVMLLDNSLSMDGSGGESTAFLQAKQEIDEILADYRSAELGLWTIGGRPMNSLGGTTFDPARVRRKLTTLQAGTGSTDLAASLTAGIAQLSSMSNPNKQLVLLSDFQTSEWERLSDADLDSMRGLLSSGEFPVHLTLMPVAGRDTVATNLSISLQDMEATPVLLNDTTAFVARVHNSGDQDANDVRVSFSVDGRDLSSRMVSVPAEAIQQVVFACEFTTAGWHHIEISVDDRGGMVGDNRAAYAVLVRQPLRLLIVDSSGGSKIDDSSGFLQLALAPFQVDGSVNIYQIQVEKGEQLRSESLEGVQAIVLADVPRFNALASQALSDFVKAGGGLIVFPGPKLDARWYNAEWVDKEPLLPMKFGEPRVAAEGKSNRIASQVIQTPILNVFNGSEAGELSSLEIDRWLEMSANENAEGNDPQPEVLVRFTNGEPLLAGRAYGKGFVVQCSTSCSDDWSNLPLRPAYVPLMQRIVALAANELRVDANVVSGDTISLSLDSESVLDSPQATIRGPGNIEIDWDTGKQASFAFNRTELPGVYHVDLGEAGSTSVVTPQIFTVALEPSESELGSLSDRDLGRVAERLGATVVNSAGDFQRLDKQRSDGQEIWRWLLSLLVVFLFGEILLGQRITKEVTS